MTNKREQIIVRLSGDKKEKLQKIADRLDTDMSSLIREKIDEIIAEYEKPKNKDSLLRSIDRIRENNEIYNEVVATSDSDGIDSGKILHDTMMSYLEIYTRKAVDKKVDEYFMKFLEEKLKDK